MPNYFHAAPLLLRAGSIIEPGNYGRLIRTWMHNPQNGYQGFGLAREMVFEARRLESAGDRPSRLNACFAFLNAHDAFLTRQQLGTANVLYEVELVEGGRPSHVADFTCIDKVRNQQAPDQGFIGDAEQVADIYWRGLIGPGSIPEFLTTSALRVIRPIEWSVAGVPPAAIPFQPA